MIAGELEGKVVSRVIWEYSGCHRCRILFTDGTILEMPHTGREFICVYANRPVVVEKWNWVGVE